MSTATTYRISDRTRGASGGMFPLPAGVRIRLNDKGAALAQVAAGTEFVTGRGSVYTAAGGELFRRDEFDIVDDTPVGPTWADGAAVREGDVFSCGIAYYHLVTALSNPLAVRDRGLLSGIEASHYIETDVDVFVGRPGVRADDGDRVLVLAESTGTNGEHTDVGEVVEVRSDRGMPTIRGRYHHPMRYVIVEKAPTVAEPDPRAVDTNGDDLAVDDLVTSTVSHGGPWRVEAIADADKVDLVKVYEDGRDGMKFPRTNSRILGKLTPGAAAATWPVVLDVRIAFDASTPDLPCESGTAAAIEELLRLGIAHLDDVDGLKVVHDHDRDDFLGHPDSLVVSVTRSPRHD